MTSRRTWLTAAGLAAWPSAAADPSFVNAGLTILPEPWQKQANYAKMERFVRQAAAQGAQVVVTPEGFLEGYVGNEKRSPGLTRAQYLEAGERIDGPLLTRARALAKELRIYLSVGFARRDGDQMFNSVAVFSPEGGLTSLYTKSHTADDEPFNTKGTAFPVTGTPHGRWGTLICFDRQLPETTRILALKGAQVVFVPSWGSYGDMNDIMMRVRAYENRVWVAFVHPRRCLIIDPRGKVVASNQGESDQIVTARIDPSLAGGKGLIDRRRPELYREILTQPE